MAAFTYNDFRKVLARLGFEMKRSRKHETWEKRLPDGRSYRVSIRHKHGKDIPRWLFHKMLKQAGIESKEEFVRILRGRQETKMTL
jgi:predicted RNA binding protein YcfA (HicA-like mRNA interferase family)